MFHHVLLRTKVLDGDRPVFVEVQPTDTLPRPSTEVYRVLRSPIPHGGDFCLVTLENERFCSFGIEHQHVEQSNVEVHSTPERHDIEGISDGGT